ncbi:hypothetical protein [Methylobacterium planeticum]|nr:hypothetical protein [Methylobacterium planeticum]
MSAASDRALTDAEDAAARWETYVSDHFIEHVQLEAIRNLFSEQADKK